MTSKPRKLMKGECVSRCWIASRLIGTSLMA
jgi:hypothetical protein